MSQQRSHYTVNAVQEVDRSQRPIVFYLFGIRYPIMVVPRLPGHHYGAIFFTVLKLYAKVIRSYRLFGSGLLKLQLIYLAV